MQGLTEKRRLRRVAAAARQGRIWSRRCRHPTKYWLVALSHPALALTGAKKGGGGGGGGGGSTTSSGKGVVTSRANLVDLGDERYKDAGETALRQQESISINQSLTTLGLVISTLASARAAAVVAAGAAQQHVPYRNGKLLISSRNRSAVRRYASCYAPSPHPSPRYTRRSRHCILPRGRVPW